MRGARSRAATTALIGIEHALGEAAITVPAEILLTPITGDSSWPSATALPGEPTAQRPTCAVIGSLAAVAIQHDRKLGPHRHEPDQVAQIVGVQDRLPVHLHDHIAGRKAGAGRRGARLDVRDHRAAAHTRGPGSRRAPESSPGS